MKSTLGFFKSYYQKMLRSIAFYPVLISSLFLVLAIIAGIFGDHPFIISFREKIPQLFIRDDEVAMTILSVLIGGVITLTIFSFTMVMVVLNQASSNFSPRLLPGLISNKKHQIILGIYIGTLLYCIIILIALGAYKADSDAMGLSTMLAALLGILCVGLFVYFIHNISESIQIHNIIARIFEKNLIYLKKKADDSSADRKLLPSVATDSWLVITSVNAGYYRGIDLSVLPESLKKQQNVIEVIPYVDQHIWVGSPVFRIKVPISDEEIQSLRKSLHIASSRYEVESSIGGMIKLMDIAVKAMSPGINDPRTAIEAIVKIGTLLHVALQIPKKSFLNTDEDPLILIGNRIETEELMRLIVQPIRFYGRNDCTVTHKLVEMLKFLSESHKISQTDKNSVYTEIEVIRSYIEKSTHSSKDKDYILNLIK